MQTPEPLLENPPLIEAIFEIRWPLSVDGAGNQVDPTFKLLAGRMFDRLASQFPHFVDLPASQLPEELAPFIVRHQFRPAADSWPVIQLGPGIATFNQTKHQYQWSTYKSGLHQFLSALFESRKANTEPTQPNRVQFRYLNSIPITDPNVSLQDFLRTQLSTTITVCEPLQHLLQSRPGPYQLDVRSSFPTGSIAGAGFFALSSNPTEGQRSILLDLGLQAFDDDAPVGIDALMDWVESGHSSIKDWFRAICSASLMKSFGAQLADQALKK